MNYIAEQFDTFKQRGNNHTFRAPIILELMKFIEYYDIVINKDIQKALWQFFPEISNECSFKDTIKPIQKQAWNALITAKIIRNDNARMKRLVLGFPFSNRKFQFFAPKDNIKSPPHKKPRVQLQTVPETNNTHNTLSPPFHSLSPNDENTNKQMLHHISQQLSCLSKKQQEIDCKLKKDVNLNISSLDDMLYSNKRGLNAFGVDKKGKEIMQIVSTAIDNDKIEYKYKLLTDILNSNSNKQIAQKLHSSE